LWIEEIDDREAVGVAIGEGIDEYGVDDGEDSGGGADAECEGEDGGESEGGAFAEFAEGVAEVGEHFEPRDVTDCWLVVGSVELNWGCLQGDVKSKGA
jgi:hypothetical protein